MGREKPREHRPSRRGNQKRIGLAGLLDKNLRMLGAGVVVSVVSCSVANGLAAADGSPESAMPRQVRTSVIRTNPFVTPTQTSGGLFATPHQHTDVLQTSDMQLSELRLKTIGTAVGLVPIGNPHCVSPTLEISPPKVSPVRLNPLAGTSQEPFESPVTELGEDELCQDELFQDEVIEPTDVAASVEPTDPRADHPASQPLEFSFTDFNEASNDDALTGETSNDGAAEEVTVDAAVAEVTPPGAAETWIIPPPPKDLPGTVTKASAVTKTEVRLQLDDQSIDDHSALPLLPMPNPNWFEAKSPVRANPKYVQRHRQHVDVAAPPMISSAAKARPGAVPAALIVPAKLAGFAMEKRVDAAPAEAPEERLQSTPVEVLPELPPPPPPVKQAETPAEKLVREVRENYPNARLTISEVRSRIVVRGECQDQEQATEIIRMIRGRMLVPVDDQLIIR